MRIRLIILFLSGVGIFPIFHIANSYAQVLDVDHFTIEDGMSQTSVNCIIQDSQGFLWVGTQDGLNKFDGYSFRVFKNEPSDTNSLSNNFINCIYEDLDGNLWIGTNLGLNKFDINTEKFTHYLLESKDINSIRENKIYNIYQDTGGYLWIKTENYLSRLNLQSNKFRHYEHYNDIFNSISITTKFPIFEDYKKQLWVGTKDGLNYFDRKLEIFKRYHHDPTNIFSISNDNVKVIFEDSGHELWIGTENGLNKFIRETESFIKYCSDCENSTGLSSDIINDIFEDNNGVIWIATDKGLHKFDKTTGKFTAYNEFLYNNEIVRTNSVIDILQDQSQIMWVATFQGLFKVEGKRTKFKSNSKSNNNSPLFSISDVVAIFKKENKVWIGTRGTGLYVFNTQNQRVVEYNTSNSAIGNDFIHKIFEDRNGNIWVGTQNGLSFFNSKTKQFEDVDRVKVLDIFKNNRIFDILEDDFDNLWIASKFGLHKIANDTIVSYFHESEDSSSLGADLVYDIYIDEHNNLWAGTEKGLSYFDLESNTKVRYTRPDDNCTNCLSNNEIFVVYEDTFNNYLWLGTRVGLNKFDLKTGEIKTYTEKDGLSNNVVYSILPDNSGNLWMSTNKGISKFNPATESFNNFGVKDGLQDFEFNHGASFRSVNGELFFGGIAGYNSFYPDSIVKDTEIPNIKITSVEVQSEKITQEIVIGKNKQIELTHKNNLITIEFAVLDFTDPEKHKYAYKLEGVEDEWINLGNRRYATFSNLPPGKYNFKVKGSNSNDVWNEEGVNLKIIVETPLWRTKLAFFGYVFLSLGLVIWIFRYRTRSLRKSNQKLKEKELIAKQIAKQKEELSIKNKSITDSIIYAKRIQEALMPTMNQFKSILPNSFILYKPKDIVSGDFYWINEKKDKIFVAIVDCTGHGVPGAFMSIIGFELLRNITDDQGIVEPDQILHHLNNGVATTFGKSTEKVRIKDGMDIALCVIDKKKAEIEFSGAFRPLYLIRNNKIEEIRGDRFSVGLLDEGESDEITKTKIKLQKEDVFYLFSDGYADQFGGSEGKKYKYRRFRHLLLTIHKLPLDQQLTYFDRSFEDWKGELEQVDDVLILGFKPELE
jgi:ligand-binding sensor domain-containing protein/serine phosphatase RsbU (regulator of sigma subunit)